MTADAGGEGTLTWTVRWRRRKTDCFQTLDERRLQMLHDTLLFEVDLVQALLDPQYFVLAVEHCVSTRDLVCGDASCKMVCWLSLMMCWYLGAGDEPATPRATQASWSHNPKLRLKMIVPEHVRGQRRHDRYWVS